MSTSNRILKKEQPIAFSKQEKTPFLRLSVLLFLLTWCVWGKAQEPDTLPTLSLPEAFREGTPAFRALLPTDSVLQTEEFKFCGKPVDISLTNRQRKLKKEIVTILPSIKVWIERAQYYFPIIEPILKSQQVPEDFKYLMVIESGMNPHARSYMGALGLWQFMPATAREYGLNIDRGRDERTDIRKSTIAACKYIKTAYAKFSDWIAVAQSYNIGQARIETELHKQDVESIDLKLVEETERYIYRILAVKMLFTKPNGLGFDVDRIQYKKIRRR